MKKEKLKKEKKGGEEELTIGLNGLKKQVENYLSVGGQLGTRH